MSQYIVVGDLGGTKCAWSFFELNATNEIASLGMDPFAVRIHSFSSFSELVQAANEHFPAGKKMTGAQTICLGAAGLWNRDKQTISLQHYWNGVADVGEAASTLSLSADKILVLNDFEAEVHSLHTSVVQKSKLLRQGKGQQQAKRRVLVGPGTGLGVAVIDHDGSLRRTESGHTPMGYPLRPQTQERWPTFMAYFKKHGITPTWEHFLSGRGLSMIHQIVAGDMQRPSEVSLRIQAGEADETRDIFAELLGMKCRSVAYSHWYPHEIYLSGGVLKNTPEILDSPCFLEAFETFAEHGEVLDAISIFLLQDPYTSLYGAGQAYVERLKS